MASLADRSSGLDGPAPAPADGALVRRHRLPVRLWHATNAFAVFVMLMSGLMIFNAHPRLYWGRYGANPDASWLEIVPGHLRIGALFLPTPGLLGVRAYGRLVAFPPFATLPSHYDLAGARAIHLAVAWMLVVPGTAYAVWGFARGHFLRDLAPRREELAPRHLWRDVRDHLRLRLPTGDAALRYNILQKLAYCAVVFGLIPLVVLTGMTMSPALNAGFPGLLTLFGGRQSARSIHFLCAAGLAAFIVVHLAMVVLAGPWNEVRSMVTGRFRVPRAGER